MRTWTSASFALITLVVVTLVVSQTTGTHAPDARSGASVDRVDLLAFGDWGEPEASQRDVAEGLTDYAGYSRQPFAGVMSLGDNIYRALSGVDDPQWQTIFEQAYDPRRLPLPFYALLGNHDCIGNTADIELAYAAAHPGTRWCMPGRWYRVDLPAQAPLVSVLMLDGNFSALGGERVAAQDAWLRAELAKPRPPWLLCASHYPMYSNGQYGDNARIQEAWGAQFARAGVDYYLCGHEHSLQHLEIPGRQTGFLVSGGGGTWPVPLRRHDRGPFSLCANGFCHLSFTPFQATVRFLSVDGRVLHVATRTCTAPVVNQPRQ